MQEIIDWYKEHKILGTILIIGIIAVVIYHLGYGCGTAICRING